MNEEMKTPPDRHVVTTAARHGKAAARWDTIPMDCPYTGKGEEFSPTNMVEAAIGGCMLISMGTLAMRNDLDISGAQIEVKTSMTDKPQMRLGCFDITVSMPAGLSERPKETRSCGRPLSDQAQLCRGRTGFLNLQLSRLTCPSKRSRRRLTAWPSAVVRCPAGRNSWKGDSSMFRG